MRLVHLNFAKGFRGGERQTQLLIEKLAQRGYDQLLLARPGSELAKALKGCPSLEIVEVKKPYLRALPLLRQGDILHAHETKGAQLAYWANLLRRTPYLITRRVDIPISSNPLNRAIYTRARAVAALSSIIAEQIRQIAPDASIAVIPSAHTDTTPTPKTVQAIRRRYADKFLILHAGALVDRHKGQSLLIESARTLEKRRPRAHFLLLGRGEDEAALKERARGLSNLTFGGFVENIADYLAAADLFAFPSRHEGLGSVLLDAMRLGLPIVAARVGGIPDILGDDNALLIPPNDPQALTEALTRLIDDNALRRQLAESAKSRAGRYSPDAMADAYETIYRKVAP